MQEWDGICACGKAEADGKRCRIGATHSAPAVSGDDDELDFLTTDEDDLDFLN